MPIALLIVVWRIDVDASHSACERLLQRLERAQILCVNKCVVRNSCAIAKPCQSAEWCFKPVTRCASSHPTLRDSSDWFNHGCVAELILLG